MDMVDHIGDDDRPSSHHCIVASPACIRDTGVIGNDASKLTKSCVMWTSGLNIPYAVVKVLTSPYPEDCKEDRVPRTSFLLSEQVVVALRGQLYFAEK